VFNQHFNERNITTTVNIRANFLFAFTQLVSISTAHSEYKIFVFSYGNFACIKIVIIFFQHQRPARCVPRECHAQRSVVNRPSFTFFINLSYVFYHSSDANFLVSVKNVVCTRVKSYVQRILILHWST
jgi:hypothetical protein